MRAEGPLPALAELANSAGAAALATEAAGLAQRLEEGRFFLACVGQFKRGKSTLLNALVGRSVLPVGVIPVTSAITVLRFGERERAQVTFANRTTQQIPMEEVGAYVSEAENPGNKKGVVAVEVFLPSPLLASGMCLVDTPGLGSVFEANTAVTREFVPHIDAALVVLGADPPISGEELALVEDVGRRIRELLMVLSKADRSSPAELEEAKRFTLGLVSKRLGRTDLAMFEISATEHLATGATTRDWGALTHRLGELAGGRGGEIVREAGRRGLARLGARLLREIDAQVDALTRPLAESESRLRELEWAVRDADRAVNELTPLFGAEEQRLARAFGAEREAFIRAAVPRARRALEKALAAEAQPSGLRQRAFELAAELAREEIEAWRPAFQQRAESEYRTVTERFVGIANRFLSMMANSGAPGLERLPSSVDPEAGFRAPSHFFFTELLTLTTVKVAPQVVDLFRTRRGRRLAALIAVDAYLERLLETNSWRLTNDAIERVRDSRRKLESELRKRLREVVDSSRRAIEMARDQLAAGASAVEKRRQSLGTVSARAQVLLSG